MEVGIFLTYGYSLSQWKQSGVLEREIKLIYEIQKKENIKFTLFTYGDKNDLKILDNKNIKVVPIYTKLKRRNSKILNYFFSFIIPFKLSKYLKNMDILHQHQLHGSWVVIISKYLFKKPIYIRTGYDMLSFAIEENKSSTVKTLYKLLTKLSLSTADMYTATNNSDKNFLNNKFKTNKEILIRPNWVEVNSEMNNSNRNKIFCVGRLVLQKNYDLLLKEFCNNTSFEIDIVGNGELEDELKKKAKVNNVKINFLGRVDYEKLKFLYSEYRYFISTSVFEGNPKTLLEAMANGCVVLASDIQHHREIIEDRVDGLLFDLSSPNLIDKLEQLENDPNLLNFISNNAIKKVKDNNSLSNLTELTFQDYKKLLSIT